MYEKVNPSHPDKIADRIAGAIVDIAYDRDENPRIAVEVLIGHGHCTIIAESSVDILPVEVRKIVDRIAGEDCYHIDFTLVPQDELLAYNQRSTLRCGDNGIFKGTPITPEQRKLTRIAKELYKMYPFDGKYVIDNDKVVICQSHTTFDTDLELTRAYLAHVNPLGCWKGGINVDCGATNRKLGSDMGDSVTGGGIHGKDLSKADVSINIYAFLKAQEIGKPIEYSCAIGDANVDGMPYSTIVEIARAYVKSIGGFEKLAEWGLIR